MVFYFDNNFYANNDNSNVWQLIEVIIRIEGTEHAFTIPEEASVFDLKVAIQEEFKYYPAPNQALFYKGSMLYDYNTLKSYEIGDGAMINFRYRIVVHGPPDPRWRCPEYELYVNDDNTVAHLKHMLHSHHGVDIANMTLRFGNQNFDNDDTKIFDYGIVPGSRIRIIPRE